MRKIVFVYYLFATFMFAGCTSMDKAYVAQMEAKRKALQALYEQDIKKCAEVPQEDKDAWERNFRSWQALNEEAAK